MAPMTDGSTELTIELQASIGATGAWATVSADRITFERGQLVAWRRAAVVARYPIDSVDALRFVPATSASASSPESEIPSAPAPESEIPSAPAPSLALTSPASDRSPAPLPPTLSPPAARLGSRAP